MVLINVDLWIYGAFKNLPSAPNVPNAHFVTQKIKRPTARPNVTKNLKRLGLTLFSWHGVDF